MNLFVTNGFCLGGVLPEFEYDALKLQYHGSLIVTNNVTLDASLNRGIFVDYAAGIEARNDSSLTQTWPITMNGLLRKSGAGTLVMAAPVRYLDANGEVADVPRSGSNIFNVVRGIVKVVKHYAMDGLVTTFEEGTSLVLALNPSDADLMKYGILNVKTDHPFNIGTGLSKVPLSVDTSACPAEMSLPQKFGIVTVKNSPATIAKVRSLLPIIRPFKDVHHRIEERINEGENSITFLLVVEHVGTRVIVR
jgi:hypothetical protein